MNSMFISEPFICYIASFYHTESDLFVHNDIKEMFETSEKQQMFYNYFIGNVFN